MPRLRNRFRDAFLLATLATLISVTSSRAADDAASVAAGEPVSLADGPAQPDARSDADCPPLATSSDPQPALVLEPGIGPGSSRVASRATRGEIVSLPAAADPRSVDAIAGEALVLIPRSGDSLAGLPPRRTGRRVVLSPVWSTMVRVVGQRISRLAN